MTKTICLCLLLTLACLPALWAQDVSGSIAGTVMDPSNAAIPNAKITVTNTDRDQVIRTLNSGPEGTYSAPLLPVGTYSLKVEAAGFRAATLQGIKLNVNDNLTLNVNLQVGSQAEQVTVAEAPVTVELGTATAANVITGTQVRELSISTRNYQMLVGLMPGVTAASTDQLFVGNSLPSGVANTMPFSINGQRNSANNWTVDGADNVDRGSNLTLLNYPSVDAIAEFKVLRSLYTADSGRAGGAQINVVTKSGASQYHGDAYEFIRNDAFAANNTYNNMKLVNLGPDGKARVSPLRYNNFGYTFGGPIRKNKTFFFFSQEFRRVIQYPTLTSTVPSNLEKQGAFSVPVCTAYTGTTCSASATQITSINPIAQQYIKDIFSKIPEGVGLADTLVAPVRSVFNHRQELIRVDHAFSEKFQLWGRFLNDSIPTTEPGGIFGTAVIPGVAITNSNSPGRTAVIHAVNSIRPTLLNEAGFNFTYGAYLSTPAGMTAKANAPSVNPPLAFANMLGVIPAVSFTGGSSVVGVGPYIDYNYNYAFFDNVTWIKGRHTLKFGITVNKYQKHENSPNGNNYGTFAFTAPAKPSSATPNFQQSWANFLLGNVTTFSQASRDITPDVRAWQWEAYTQDDFRVTPRLTLYAGLRYSFFGQPKDANGLLSNFDPQSYQASAAPRIDPANGNIIANTGAPLTGLPSGMVNVWSGLVFNNLNSRFGGKVANDVWTNLAPRVGLAWDPFGAGKTSVRAGYGLYYDSSLFGIYEQNILINPPYVQSLSVSGGTFANPTGGTANVSAAPLALRGTASPYMTPYSQQWSLDLQQQIGKSFVLDLGYYGSKGTHLLGIIDLNQVRPGVAYAAGLHQGAGTAFISGTDSTRINAVRPYLGYNAINVVEPWFDSNYHSLQVSAQRDFHDAGMFQLSYTWSKNLTDNGSDRSNAPQSTYNFHDGEYGPAALDRRHVLSINYVYELPFFKNAKCVLGHLLKGWQLSGIISYGTGLPTTVTTTGVDPAGLGLLGSSASSARPDLICNPNANAPHTVAQWFNTSCFALVPSGEIRPGNEGRYVLRLPGYERWDFTLSKNFQLNERFKLQMRGETFNVFNHANPSAFGSVVYANALFGTISGFRDPRIVQLAGKLYF
jgi:hypothetical protein